MGHLKDILGDTWEDTEVSELIKEADINNDGNISYDEFLEYFHKDDPDQDPGSPMDSPKSNRNLHIEKLAKVVDNIVDGDGLSPKTPNPLKKSVPSKAWPAMAPKPLQPPERSVSG